MGLLPVPTFREHRLWDPPNALPTSARLSLEVEGLGERAYSHSRDSAHPLTYSKLGSETEFHKWENACNLCN